MTWMYYIGPTFINECFPCVSSFSLTNKAAETVLAHPPLLMAWACLYCDPGAGAAG